MKIRSAAVGFAGLVIAASTTQAAMTFNLSSGTRSAQVVFDTSGTNLVVTLTNTALGDALLPVDVITSMFFNVSGGPLTLTPLSATLNTGSTIVGKVGAIPAPATDPGNSVGGEWAYKSGLIGAPGAGAYGIGSAGLGIFGPSDRFPGTNLQGPMSPGGLQYAVTTAGDDPSTGNGDYNSNALIKNSIVFTLSGLPAGFDLGRITDVTVLYGTSPSDPFIKVPTPGSLALFGAGILLAGRRRR